ncbi:MAG TPA: response regulator, partial [Candidatus Saccharimonadales bacterium]|jgi:two-component system cell cycle sensor histidine kinase/response regulator CckA|nr:response regulator [Candidatus Saccharimonadales bacterium]
LRALRAGTVNVAVDRVSSEVEFRKRLEKTAYDIVLADYGMPGWTGLAAFQLLQSMHMDIPFILVTGSLGEELAAECMKQGMSDYILKDRLTRLPNAVAQAIQRKEAAQALRRSETEFRSLVDHAPVGIYRSSVVEDRFLAVNPALVTMLGYASAEEVLQLSLSRDVYIKAGERRKVLEQTAEQDFYIGTELLWKRKNGTHVTVRVAGRSIRDAQGVTAIHEAVAEDITEQRSLEQQLRQAQKMEAVGQLAGGVAHDFNNLLMVVNSCAELTRRNESDPARVRQYADQIIAAVTKASLVTRQLLTFSRKQVFQPRVLDLNLLLREFVKFLPHLIGEDVEMALVTTEGPVFITIDAGQAEQIVMNLAVNARDAMPQGGKLVIAIATADQEGSDAPLHPGAPAGHYVTLAVSDSGVGMDMETKGRIFEPFFTTKETGKGTGLGLATVFGIVKQVGGYISVESEPGQGTTFRIYFPRVEQPSRVALTPEVIAEELSKGSETVLLVEDEDGLRSITKEFLESIGYKVMESRNGGEAIDLMLKYQAPIHVLLTDLVMPGMHGSEVAIRLKQAHPRAKVILMSGYSNRAVQLEKIGADSLFLQKPFPLTTLAQKIRSLLDSATPSETPLPRLPYKP